jgi:hypothetical protein
VADEQLPRLWRSTEENSKQKIEIVVEKLGEKVGA